MAQSFFRAITRRGKISSLRTLTTTTRCSSSAQYPDAQYTQKMPDDVDFFYPKLGNRDIVGFGLNGDITYLERPSRPYPAVRFRENTPELLALREKAKGDWKNLTLEEKKTLYRADFCQTFAEMQAPTGEWRSIWATVFFGWAFTLWMLLFLHEYVYPPKPKTITREWQEATVERMIQARHMPVTGVSSLWDYEKGQWK